MCDHGTSTVVATPTWLWGGRARPECGVSIDSCISAAIEKAWGKGVRTLGSCCGHGSNPPSVVLTDDPEQPMLARIHLPGFVLYQWQLTDVTRCGHD